MRNMVTGQDINFTTNRNFIGNKTSIEDKNNHVTGFVCLKETELLNVILLVLIGPYILVSEKN